MSRVLTVYFSRTGFTRKIAEEMKALLDGDVESIEDVRGRSGILGYLRSAREALKKTTIDIRPGRLRPKEFDLVILGTPVWAGHVSSPMRAYLTAHKGEFQQVAFFCTLGGSGASSVFTEMAALCQHEPIATLAVTDAAIKRDSYRSSLNEFTAAVGRRGSPPSS